ncbi:MAG: S9 family peptidase [Caulobacteraceae bacterium]|nr:S9 family peptidase [Caulobacter sp.]
MTRSLAALLVSAALLPAAARAELLTPERAFAAPELAGPVARGVAFSPDGKLVTFLRAKPDDQTTLDLWAIPAAGGEPRRLVDARAFEPKNAVLSEAEKSRRERQRISEQGVVDYTWDEQGKAILVPLDGDLYLADPATGGVRRLTQTPGDEVDSRVSPRGGYVSFVRDQNLYVLPLAQGSAERALTSDGKGVISYGTAEFVAQEELDRYTGYWWSPDDARIAYTRVDEGPVDIVPRVDIGANGTTVTPQRYPRAGRPNAVVQLYVRPLAPGGAPVKVDLGADTNVYLARVNWSKDGRTLYVQRLARDQQTLDLLMVDPATGASKVIVHEAQTPWIDLNDNFTALKDGTFIFGSERTGFNHLYLYSREGRLIRAITHGDWPVTGAATGAGAHAPGVAAVDEARGLVYFTASKESPTERQLYVTSYKAPGEPRAITHGHGWWSATVSQDAARFVGSYSDPDTPPQTALYDIAGQRLRWIEENRLAPGHPFYPYLDHKPSTEFGTLPAADGTPLHWYMRKPAGFDPARRYPVIVKVYGGPDVQQVTRTWEPASDQLLTEAGYVVFQLDNRGSSNRGVKFEAPIAGHLGVVETQDQFTGVAWLKRQPFVDPARIGVMGWSYGGFMTLRMLTEPGQPFKAGAGGGPPTDWRLYDTAYTERFMGLPEERKAAYDAASIPPRLENLSGRLLLLHGMSDDNVVFENSTRAMARLQELGTPFDLMLYPGQRHGIRGPKRQLQLWRTYLAFFARQLGGSTLEPPQS